MAASRRARHTGSTPLLALAASVAHAQTDAAKSPDEIRLKDYRPKSIYKIPVRRRDCPRQISHH